MYKKLVFKSKQEVSEFIDTMFQNYGYHRSFSSPCNPSKVYEGEWVTIELFNGLSDFMKNGDDYIHYWHNGNSYDKEVSIITKDTVIRWLWEDRKYAYVSMNELY